MARQDPIKVDATHYKVEFENRQVRVLRVRYGSRERSVMHGHPASVGVHLTDAYARFTFPGGKTEELRVTAGEVRSYPAGDHLPRTRLGGTQGAGGSKEAYSKSRGGEEASREEAGTTPVKGTGQQSGGRGENPGANVPGSIRSEQIQKPRAPERRGC